MDMQNTVTIEVPRFDTVNSKANAGIRQGLPPAESTTQEVVDILAKARGEHVRILDQAESEAARLIHEAAVAADTMKQEAAEESNRLREEILETAQKQGYADGFGKGDEEHKRVVAEAERLRAETLKERERTYAAIEPDMIALMLGITKKILGDAADINPQVISNLIRQGLAEATLTGTLTLRVSKEDYETVMADKEQLVAIAEGSHIEIVRDISLAKSDCIIETAYGNIDCSLDRQFESFAQHIRYIMNAAKPETADDSN